MYVSILNSNTILFLNNYIIQESGKKKYDEVFSRIKTSTNLADAKDCDLIIEVCHNLMSCNIYKRDYNNIYYVHYLSFIYLSIQAIIEKEDIKIDFYKKLGPMIQPNCVFASNTSSLAITNMAIASGRPDKFVGLHFFNPVQVMKLVEVISTGMRMLKSTIVFTTIYMYNIYIYTISNNI